MQSDIRCDSSLLSVSNLIAKVEAKEDSQIDETPLDFVTPKIRSISSDFSDLGDFDYETESFGAFNSFSSIPEERFQRNTTQPLSSQTQVSIVTSNQIENFQLLPGEVLLMRVENAAYIVFCLNDPALKIDNSQICMDYERKDTNLESNSEKTQTKDSDLRPQSTMRSRSFANLGAAGHKVNTLNRFVSHNAEQSAGVTRSLGRGLFRASHSLGRELFKGAAGLVSQTFEGSASGSILGFAKGLGLGVLGLGNHAVKGAVRGMNHVTNLVGEMVLGAAPHFSLDGVLLVTTYRIVWISQSFQDSMEVPISSIYSIENSPTAPHVLHIECRNPLRPTFAFDDEDLCYQIISAVQNLFAENPHTFAFKHALAACRDEADMRTISQANLVSIRKDLQDDYSRLGLMSKAFQIFDNSNWILPSYPSTIILPSSLSEEEILAIADYRSAKRIPAIVWRHPENGALMCRCSQPCVGLSGVVSVADQKIISLLANDKPFHFVDARSQIAAAANLAQGKGTEDVRNYPGSILHYCDIMNIHAMRTSYWHLGYVCQPGRIREGEQWETDLAQSQWLKHVQQILKSVLLCCKLLTEGESLLVHCSDGWDRTPQLTSLTELLIDPFYRTLQGFITLVNKEWCCFGHLFKKRYAFGFCPGHQETEEESPVFIQWLDCVWQIWHQNNWAFEFNEAFLLFIHDHIFTCLYGTFLYDCERERYAQEDITPTLSIWDAVLEKKLAYINSSFDAPCHQKQRNVQLPVDLDKIILWNAHIAKADPIYRRYVE